MTDIASGTTIAAADATDPAGAVPATAGHPSGALNRFFAAVDRLPGRGWWVYPAMFLALAAWYQVAHWLTGSLPLGSLTLKGLDPAVYGPYVLAVTHLNVRSIGPRAVDAFRPASGMSDEAYAARRRELLEIPSWVVWPSIAIGAVIAIGGIFSASAEGLAPYGGTASAALVNLGPASLFGYSGAVFLFIQAIRQLRLVNTLHGTATAIDPFDVGPIYAFSRLTSFVGGTIVLASYFGLLANGAYQAGNAFGIATIVGTVSVGIACFIVPLWGIHGRLVEAKATLIRAGSLRSQALQERLYGKVDSGDLTGVKDIGDAIAAVRSTHERTEKLPTWPWPPQVLRGFLSAILLPVIVFLITRYVGTQVVP